MGMPPELKKSIAEYVMGKRSELTLVGQASSISVIYEAAKASRNLMIALNSGDLSTIKHVIEQKRVAVSRYETVFGSEWNL